MEKHLEYLDSLDINSNKTICYCLSLVASMPRCLPRAYGGGRDRELERGVSSFWKNDSVLQ